MLFFYSLFLRINSVVLLLRDSLSGREHLQKGLLPTLALRHQAHDLNTCEFGLVYNIARRNHVISDT